MELFPQIYKFHKLDKYLFLGRKKPGLVIRASCRLLHRHMALCAHVPGAGLLRY